MVNSWHFRLQLVVMVCGAAVFVCNGTTPTLSGLHRVIVGTQIIPQKVDIGIKNDAFDARRRLVIKLTADSEVNRQILPVMNNTTPVRLGIEVTLRQISTVDEVNQAIRLTTWLRIYWNNPFLEWDPKDYDNITSINIDNELIWKPDIAVYNKASLEEEIDILYKRMSTSIEVKSTGNCRWLAPATLLSQCRINVADFPFDEQNCFISFGSWTYAGNQIDVYAPKPETYMKDYIKNGEWDVVQAPLKRNVLVYPGNKSYPEVTLHLQIRRQPLYYTLNLIIPCTVIAILALLSFMLPTNHGERVSLVITVLLAMSVYMLIVSSTLPQTSDAIPVIGTYFLVIIVLIALSLLATCFIAGLRGQEGDIPRWMDVAVNKWLRRVLLMNTNNDMYQSVTENAKSIRADAKIKLCNGNSQVIEITSETLESLLADKETKLKVDVQQQRAIEQAIVVLANDVVKRQKREGRLHKWRRAAEAFDRLFLVTFTFCFVVLVAAIFG